MELGNPMREIRIEKVTVNMGVGEGGEKLAKAEKLLEEITGQKPVRTYAKVTNQTFGIRKGMPIGCKVTLRKAKAEEFLKKAFAAVDNKIKKESFDREGNLSFGIREHIDIPGMKYDPKVGIFGMDVCVTMERPGYRVKRRRIQKRKIPHSHRVTREESIAFFEKEFNIKVNEE
ncbi:MAG: 50S ribosomal protein L5 [Candidatus Hydrothermarchaeota archaeon]|nr:MAG: 50S ribosomal protein L5 [Candidatus Hydrothermarchaeota archaeon]